MKRTKELGVDRQGIPLTMHQKDFWAYGIGVAGITVITQIIGQFSYFYTDKVGLTAGLAGSALMISKIADAFTDLIMGYIVDRTKSKHGKARPWMLWMAPFVLAAVIMMLCVPTGMGMIAKFIYAIISNVFASAIVTTAISVPYACLLNYRTQSQVERTKMNVRRTIVNYFLGMFFSVAFVPLTAAMGGTQKAWIMVSVIMAAVASLAMVVTFVTIKEQNTVQENKKQEEGKENKVDIKEEISVLFHNKYWVIMALTQLIANVCYSLNAATGVYYAKWIFGNESIVGIMGLIGFIPTILGFFIISPLVQRFGAIKVVKGGLLLGVIGSIGKALFPRSFFAVCGFGMLTSVSTMPYMMVGMVLIANVADFEEWKSGKKMVGLVNSASSFGAKVGAGLGAGMIGWILAIGGYQASAAVQTESAITSVFVISIWLPAILIILLFVLMCMYDLDKKYPNYRAELMEKRKQAEDKG